MPTYNDLRNTINTAFTKSGPNDTVTPTEIKAGLLQLIDRMELAEAIYSVSSNILFASDSTTIPTANKSYTLAVPSAYDWPGNSNIATFSNLKNSAGSAAPAITISKTEWDDAIAIVAEFSLSANTWAKKVVLKKAGPAGPAGPAGANGTNGTNGSNGGPGPANTLSIGTVDTGATAAASITGAAPNQTLNLTLPQAPEGTGGTLQDVIENGNTVVNPDFGSRLTIQNITGNDGPVQLKFDTTDPGVTGGMTVNQSMMELDNGGDGGVYMGAGILGVWQGDYDAVNIEPSGVTATSEEGSGKFNGSKLRYVRDRNGREYPVDLSNGNEGTEATAGIRLNNGWDGEAHIFVNGVNNTSEAGAESFNINHTKNIKLLAFDGDSETGLELQTEKVVTNKAFQAVKFFVSANNVAPESQTDTGIQGEIRFCDSGIFYCTATNFWLVSPLIPFS